MTSKHCYSKGIFGQTLREDFRHKIWMLALSILGNLLALPVCYLLYSGSRGYMDIETAGVLLSQAQTVVDFFESCALITGGVIAIAGALIVGLAGFRYVFHRNMVDTYHSLPVKRRTLFLAGWLDGFLIWLVPYIVSMIVTAAFGEIRLRQLYSRFQTLTAVTPEYREAFEALLSGSCLKEALITAIVTMAAFLLVYHLVLVAVMLCGNVLNTLVVSGVFGVGAVSAWALWFILCENYLDTYVGQELVSLQKAIYASPLASSVYLLYRRAESFAGADSFGVVLSVNLVIALLLGVLAALLYIRRDSELAEQGLKAKPVYLAVQVVTSLVAGVGGWLVFWAIAAVSGQTKRTAWGIFGALLVSILAFGVLNIVFRMDFKAFFRRWGLMAVTAVCAVLIGIGFRFDIFGYDTYLPDAEKIAGIAIKDNASDTGTQYSYFSDTAGDEMEMFYTDREVIYDFLQAATAYERDGYPRGSDRLSSWNTSTILARVTLTNGRSYDRYYTVASTDNEAAFTILTSEEYQNASCRIPETEIFTSILVRRNGLRQGDDTGIEEASQIRDAFNLDLAENPELMVSGGGSLLCKVTLSGAESNRYFSVYDSMTHTVEALRENGFGSYVEPLAAEDIQEIWIGLNIWQSDVDEDTDLVQYAADLYGVELDDDHDSEKQAAGVATEDRKAYATENTVQSWEDDDELGLTITDPEEIAELLGLVSYDWGTSYENAFRGGFTGDVRAVTKEGESVTLFLPDGALPQKYVLRCGGLK